VDLLVLTLKCSLLFLFFLLILGIAIDGILARKNGISGAHLITCSCLITSAVIAILAFYEVGICLNPISINLIS